MLFLVRPGNSELDYTHLTFIFLVLTGVSFDKVILLL